MAKKSMVQRELKRKSLVERYNPKRKLIRKQFKAAILEKATFEELRI